MKKLLFVLPFLALLGGCAKDTEAPLPEPSKESKSVKLTKSNSTLTNTALEEAKQVSLDIEGSEQKYTFEFSAGCYGHSDYDEFVLKGNNYLKSVSNYKVDRLVIDYMDKNGLSFEVKNANDEVVTSHESTTQTEYSGAKDYGAVLEFPINGTSWSLVNTNTGKAGTNIYSVTVIFEI